MPVFSIIIPVYNMQIYLEECLNSVLNQSFSDYEAILVDDGSSDLSGEICDKYAKEHSKIKVIHQENKGLAGARNTGLEAACGEWIYFLDSDDYISVDLLETLYKEIQDSRADLVSFNAWKTDADGNVFDKLLYVKENLRWNIDDEEAKFALMLNSFFSYGIGWECCMRTYKRSIIQKQHLIFHSTKDVMAEDLLFTYQYLLHAKKISAICNILYYYRQQAESLLHKMDRTTVLKRLFCLLDYAYLSAVDKKYRYFSRNFYKLFFCCINHHVRYMLGDINLEIIRKEIQLLTKKQCHKKWMKQIRNDSVLTAEYRKGRVWF